MDELQKAKVDKKIGKILNCFVGAEANEITIEKISYLIKCYLEKKNIDYQTIDLYTPEEKLKQGMVDIRIDGELYPFTTGDSMLEKEWATLARMQQRMEVFKKGLAESEKPIFNTDYITRKFLNLKDGEFEVKKQSEKTDSHPTWGLTIFKVGYYEDERFVETCTPCSTAELAQTCADELNFLHGENKKFVIYPIVVRTS